MSNFNTLMENKNFNTLIPEIVYESFTDLMISLDDEQVQKLEEYSGLLNDKKLKRSLEEEISEALMPILERNTVLYGSFLYETVAIEEGCCEDSKSKLSQIREMLGVEFVSEAANPQRRSRMRRAGAGLAAGLGAGAAGLGAAYAAGEGDTAAERVASGARRGVDAVRGAAGAARDRVTGGMSYRSAEDSYTPQDSPTTAEQEGAKFSQTGMPPREADPTEPSPEYEKRGPSVTDAELRRFRPGMSSSEISKAAGIAPEKPEGDGPLPGRDVFAGRLKR